MSGPAPAVLNGAVFDLDGTLLNTLDDIVRSVNGVFVEEGLGERTPDEIRRAVGSGMRNLVLRLAPLRAHEGDLIGSLVEGISGFYGNLDRPRTRPYPGVREMLIRFRDDGLPMAVLTNKPQESAEDSIRRHFEGIPFAAVRGAIEGLPLKPSPDAAAAVLEKMNLEPEGIIMVGDSEVDMETALNAGMVPVGVTWGFRDRGLLLERGARHLADSPADILRLVELGRCRA